MKSKKVAFFLALFGGAFGLHWFYLNNTKKGLIYLLFFWTGISWFFSLADMVMILSSDNSEFDHYLVADTQGRYSLRNWIFQVQPITGEYDLYNSCDDCGSNDFYKNTCNYCGIK